MTERTHHHSENLVICEAEPSDYAAIYAIYAYYIEQTDNNWNHRPKSLDVFKAHFDLIRQMDRPAIVARLTDSVIGYGALHEFRSADGYWPCAENSVYVHPDHQGQGIGRMLMTALLEQARTAGLWAVIAVIDSGNQSSIQFHEQFGFTECGRLSQIGEKNHHALSAVFMQYDIPENRSQFLKGV